MKQYSQILISVPFAAPLKIEDADDPLSPQAQRQHLRDLIATKTRRIRHLEKREATQGIATDPKDRIEIDDLHREIGELEGKLKELGR